MKILVLFLTLLASSCATQVSDTDQSADERWQVRRINEWNDMFGKWLNRAHNFGMKNRRAIDDQAIVYEEAEQKSEIDETDVSGKLPAPVMQILDKHQDLIPRTLYLQPIGPVEDAMIYKAYASPGFVSASVPAIEQLTTTQIPTTAQAESNFEENETTIATTTEDSSATENSTTEVSDEMETSTTEIVDESQTASTASEVTTEGSDVGQSTPLLVDVNVRDQWTTDAEDQSGSPVSEDSDVAAHLELDNQKEVSSVVKSPEVTAVIEEVITTYEAEHSPNAVKILENILQATSDIVGDIVDPDEQAEDSDP